MVDSYKEAWEESYKRLENTLFYPNEEVVRFVNRHIRRRISPTSYSREFDTPPKILDVGCGAGRHLVYFWENGFYPIGVELSENACEQARTLMASKGADDSEYHLISSSFSKNWKTFENIDYAVSVSALDSMPTSAAIAIVHNVFCALRPGALFYADVISNEKLLDGPLDSDFDQIVNEKHEKGTIQSYYDKAKIERVFESFCIENLELHHRYDDMGNMLGARWHGVFKKSIK